MLTASSANTRLLTLLKSRRSIEAEEACFQDTTLNRRLYSQNNLCFKRFFFPDAILENRNMKNYILLLLFHYPERHAGIMVLAARLPFLSVLSYSTESSLLPFPVSTFLVLKFSHKQLCKRASKTVLFMNV